ncbi:MAG: hypothetical protein K6G25_09385 [Bacteroidales bacterium]|nr:hypothetical protein [Bacteroidales bacterium]
MKKVLLALAVVAMVFSVTSCNKQKKCQCTWKVGNATIEGDVFLTEEGKTCSDYEATFNYSEIDCHRVY